MNKGEKFLDLFHTRVATQADLPELMDLWMGRDTVFPQEEIDKAKVFYKDIVNPESSNDPMVLPGLKTIKTSTFKHHLRLDQDELYYVRDPAKFEEGARNYAANQIDQHLVFLAITKRYYQWNKFPIVGFGVLDNLDLENHRAVWAELYGHPSFIHAGHAVYLTGVEYLRENKIERFDFNAHVNNAVALGQYNKYMGVLDKIDYLGKVRQRMSKRYKFASIEDWNDGSFMIYGGKNAPGTNSPTYELRVWPKWDVYFDNQIDGYLEVEAVPNMNPMVVPQLVEPFAYDNKLGHIKVVQEVGIENFPKKLDEYYRQDIIQMGYKPCQAYMHINLV